jgi:hypothetical protein
MNTVASYCGSPFVVLLPRDFAEAQVMVLEHPLRIEVVRRGLLAHGPLQQPLAGKMIEQRGIDRRLLRHHGQSRQNRRQDNELLHRRILHSKKGITLLPVYIHDQFPTLRNVRHGDAPLVRSRQAKMI